MKNCAFFGHKVCEKDLLPELESVIEGLICKDGVLNFYVGNVGQFDHLAATALKRMKRSYPINIYVVLSYLPNDSVEYGVLPEGIEMVPPRFAIEYCNNYMMKRCDVVVSYVASTVGGAAKFVRKAGKQSKRVINLAEVKNMRY